ncbi:MAG: metallopeptidase [Candidatus Bathyarchaeota archaeon]|nr:MAG: metallopeptidase [Candidatus Bathyarchaeota archaeon]
MGWNLTLKYVVAPDVKQTVDKLIQTLSFRHIAPKNVYCYRSYGSKSKRIIARIHGLGKIWQQALHHPTTYIIEVLSEKYDSLNQENKEKTLIHELLHIPMGFSGGFRPHKGYITTSHIDQLYQIFKNSEKRLK